MAATKNQKADFTFSAISRLTDGILLWFQVYIMIFGHKEGNGEIACAVWVNSTVHAFKMAAYLQK